MNSKIGVVLSSGGGRGIYAHTGFTMALQQLNIAVKAVAGCSAGAVVGSIIASGGDIMAWSRALCSAETNQFWQPKSKLALLFSALVKQGVGFIGLADTKAPIEFISKFLGVNNFEQCLYPFSVVAINIGNGDKVIFRAGEIAPQVMASAAMPVFYEPVEIDNQYYSDGATVDLAPADAICCHYELDIVIVHHVADRSYTVAQLKESFTKPWSIANIIYRLIYRHKAWYETGKDISFHRCPCGCKATIVVIEPKLNQLAWPITKGGSDIMQVAKQHTLDVLGSYFASGSNLGVRTKS